MAKKDIVKDFVQQQTAPLTIGVPKKKAEPVAPAPAAAPVNEAPRVKGKVGRPKLAEDKVKLSLYITAEKKAKLVKIQHQTYRANMNDVLSEAVDLILEKYTI